ncbi:CapA family protein [Altererythrobacter arenosus]|uniref:CapA family protein n=1 Tax=Altererythrobacter arenosus TaxID=3032592 RepID=A0ABY8FN22_9SPHN|nr:CapA family protein [Altererythrobacter sp. CAU 1644]WFL76419.1 CapA family protein [Altererythrobacter sp. CAU 1644]
MTLGKMALAALAGMTVPATFALAKEPQQFQASGVIDTAFDRVSANGLTAKINGQAATVHGEGAYAVQVPIAPYYQIVVEGGLIHPTVQTFGHNEIYRAICDCLQIPAIEVVARKAGRIELLFAGDAMAGRRYVEPIWGERQLIDPADPLPDIKALLEPMRPYVETADLASVNLEIVLSDRDFGNSPPKSVTFYASPALAHALADAGFDHVSLGNNHSYDLLEEGVVSTIDAVERAGLAWSGAGLNEEQALRASRLDVGGQALSLLGYVGWKGSVEPNQVAEAGKGGAAHGSDKNIAASVAREAALGRNIIAQYHGSREYSDGPTEESERRMKLAVDRGAALVASHHPHVPQGIELYNDGLIAYSSGNFLFDQYFLETHGSFVLRAWLDDGKVARAEVIPIRILDYRPVPAVGSMREAILDRLERLSAARGTRIDRNGGHGVIVPRASRAEAPLARMRGCGSGEDLLRSGDFENATYGDANDRSLKAEGGKIAFPMIGSGGHVLQLTPASNSARMTVSPSTFFRNTGGTQFEVCGSVFAPADVRLSLGHQMRQDGQGRFDALEGNPVSPAGKDTQVSGGAWHDFSITFQIDSSDRGKPLRPMLTIAATDGSLLPQVALDNLRILMRD